MEYVEKFLTALGGLYVFISLLANVLPQGKAQAACAKVALALRSFEPKAKQ